MEAPAYYCLYKTSKCRNPRGLKRDGTLHRMCNDHRAKANESQRKSEAKKRYRKHVLKRPAYAPYTVSWSPPFAHVDELPLTSPTWHSPMLEDDASTDEEHMWPAPPKMALAFILDADVGMCRRDVSYA
ncbi:hypothetical protein SDRG_14186 [Saprolegnia diclina VS20]|uniref:Uncharacterized protein n=1 Tax=Saprolegnia diclina (strain VS20) TaxID=1156394 RepID=T0R7N3_SAPDV|nr:hypothetical protein SDRG_14186 [Saprolegnia diclina VS20]EQC28093.1 hypothetical protein SDRG_14186 [Saprolegnia diclina VS20]|eukprot:XP_008618518.1 hypothetical protein SDRG_14186 [Saprolegnia diclina VS20]